MNTTDPTPELPPAGLDTAQRNYPLLLKRMERLMEIGQDLASTLELGRLLHHILEAARELTDTEAASILLLDPRSGELRFEAATNIEAVKLQDVVVPLNGSLAGWIAMQAKPVVVPEAQTDPRWNSAVDEATAFVTRSLIGVPLMTQNRTIGVLEAVNKRRGTFAAEDVTTLQWLAAHAAVAIVNARLFQQSDLVAEMVHELRTPLTALMASSQLLLRPELSETHRRELVETLQRETGRLTELTTSFLDMAKLDSGRMRFDLARFDLAALIEECLDVIGPQASARGLSVASNVEPNLPQLVSDRGKVKQVLLNLLTNAVKYNRPGGEIRVKAEVVPGGLRVSVADTGQGIPAEAAPRIFERFYRVPDSDGYVTGSGLGLTIAKRLVEALNGEIGFASRPGMGSTFYFRLPAAPESTGPGGGNGSLAGRSNEGDMAA